MSLIKYINQNRDIMAAAGPLAAEQLSRIQPLALYPAVLRMTIRALEICRSKGKVFWITQGERTWDEQHQLYLKGRRGIPGEGKVTTVDAGDSAHNYAIAVDGVFDKDPSKGLQPSWDKTDIKIWADACIEVGLDAGYYWKNFFDGPHAQLDVGSVGISPRKQLKSVYAKGGKEAVFAVLDKYNW
jgi:hypothetical protein